MTLSLVSATAVAAARNYLPRQRYRLSRQIARCVSRHFVVPLLSFLIRRRDKRGRAVPFRMDFTIATWSIFAPRDRSRGGEILFLRRHVARRRSIRPAICRREMKRSERDERRAAIFFDHLTDRDELSSNSRRGAAAGLVLLSAPLLVSLVFFCSQRETSENSPIAVPGVTHNRWFFNGSPYVIRSREKKKKTFVPEMSIRNVYRRNIDFPSELLYFLAAYWIFVSILQIRKIYWIFIFTL